MNDYSSLYEMIQALQHGNRFHISVQFFSNTIKRHMSLPFAHTIHSTEFCDAVKQRPKGLARCLMCKRLANEKAHKTKKPFGGRCVNGAYEYCYPVFKGNTLLCIVYVGNIIQDMDTFLKKSKLAPDDPIIATMEPCMPESVCHKIASVLGSYILLLTQTLPDSSLEKPVNTTIAAVKSYVDYYFFHDITLSGLAKLYHYNEKYLGALFKQQMHVSFHDYLNYRRLQHARMLLQQSRDSILDIATRSGFNNVTYFNRIFKAKYGLTPSQYRIKCKK